MIDLPGGASVRTKVELEVFTCDGQIKEKPGFLWKTVTDDLNFFSVCVADMKELETLRQKIYKRVKSEM